MLGAQPMLADGWTGGRVDGRTDGGGRDPLNKRPARRLGAAAGAVSSPPGRARVSRQEAWPPLLSRWGGWRAADAPPNMPCPTRAAAFSHRRFRGEAQGEETSTRNPWEPREDPRRLELPPPPHPSTGRRGRRPRGNAVAWRERGNARPTAAARAGVRTGAPRRREASGAQAGGGGAAAPLRTPGRVLRTARRAQPPAVTSSGCWRQCKAAGRPPPGAARH